ncbi:hypothetical protein GBA63_11595 [Rubrobacter tropicus]|uniref:Uncharacterized protein n=1 Tax=Rubrobacter tropicus TaxID=2653851 RepID=A0A6G8Q9U4_9ACTN|nr:hypothetical protein [Rubrobacter tropicus]QIN83213.1 hypothetical protein GBA63_11595 [Rubrobacter tropicus]
MAGVLSLFATGTIWYYFGGLHAGAYLYGVGVGVVCFTSIAVTAALLGGGLSGDRIVLGLAVYFGRLAFAAVALGVPIYLGSLPAVPLLCGFAGVYVIENVVLLVGAPAKMAGENSAVRSGHGGVERRTEV